VFAPSVDLKIKNDTSASVLIEIEIDKSNMILTFKLFGKKDKRKVEISTPVLYDVQPPPPPRYQDDPTLKKGEIKQVDFAAWGGKAYYNYRVTYPNNHIEEKKIFSAYKPWQAVFLQGTAD
jgi:vancomycin resistance protein YoaR